MSENKCSYTSRRFLILLAKYTAAFAPGAQMNFFQEASMTRKISVACCDKNFAIIF